MAKDLKVKLIKSLTADDDLLQIRMVEFNDKPRLDIRKFYVDKVSGDLKPSGKGIALDHDTWTKVMLTLGDNDNKIEKFLAPKAVRQIEPEIHQGEGDIG